MFLLLFYDDDVFRLVTEESNEQDVHNNERLQDSGTNKAIQIPMNELLLQTTKVIRIIFYKNTLRKVVCKRIKNELACHMHPCMLL
jgi:hypothetical protein